MKVFQYLLKHLVEWIIAVLIVVTLYLLQFPIYKVITMIGA